MTELQGSTAFRYPRGSHGTPANARSEDNIARAGRFPLARCHQRRIQDVYLLLRVIKSATKGGGGAKSANDV